LRVAVSSNPHASPSRLSANSFSCAHTQTTQAKKMAHTLSLRYTQPTEKICFTVAHGNSEFRDLHKELISPFKWLTLLMYRGQKVSRCSQHTAAVMWSKLQVKTGTAELESTACTL